MNITVSLKNVRDQLSDLVSRVSYGDQKVVITRFGKPVAAIVTYQDYERIMNPYKRFSKDEWEEGFALMDKMRESAKHFPQDKVEEAIANAVEEVRKQKRV
jgi:prevent-host-death family protein